ncbi:hypothetical protein [Variovorax atrisoli]|uniref:hypothetical protein n=1 Tax=Variovorax atrisoli TaxID=3394203 RepID=UPI0016162A76|nr:hypothetical protein [Variovorax sp. BK613]MBB3639809.1 hypothetical protein [Variovorax sp. BK613]
MTPTELLNALTPLAARLASYISTGAQYEVTAQAEMALQILAHFNVMGREIPYPGSQKTCDLAYVHQGEQYWVELKVESAHHAGTYAGKPSMDAAIMSDITKLRTLAPAGSKRWMIVVAYSVEGRARLDWLNMTYGLTCMWKGDHVSIAIFDAMGNDTTWIP